MWNFSAILNQPNGTTRSAKEDLEHMKKQPKRAADTQIEQAKRPALEDISNKKPGGVVRIEKSTKVFHYNLTPSKKLIIPLKRRRIMPSFQSNYQLLDESIQDLQVLANFSKIVNGQQQENKLPGVTQRQTRSQTQALLQANASALHQSNGAEAPVANPVSALPPQKEKAPVVVPTVIPPIQPLGFSSSSIFKKIVVEYAYKDRYTCDSRYN
jgi:hypothetical protein